ncbi:hypothetical protein BRC68_17935 [Halobacteriales archaeon QH_6_64_20]|nr:MAG: hypothetical protein BRC68_17935 [Halobacteriales archaeon QH_6_64_20]
MVRPADENGRDHRWNGGGRGGIVLGPAEEFTDVEADDTSGDVVDSIALSRDSALWPDGVVPYEIASDLPNTNTNRVHDAIDHWEANTPIEFVQHTNQNDFIEFVPANGCSSFVGRRGGRQPINLAGGCGTGSTIHEIAHAVGIWHEQSRSDRDVFIDVKFDNIEEGKAGNFRKHEGANDIGRYDHGSIMHYPPYGFSKNRDKTIEAPEPIGQRRGLSEGDLDAAFRLYGPSDAGTVGGVTDDRQGISFDSDVSPDPVVLAGVQTFNGDDPVGVRMRDLGDGNAEVFVEEEESANSETSHAEERVGFFATDEGTIVDENASPVGEAGVVATGQAGASEWHTVRLDGTYSDPVVSIRLLSYNGNDPSHLRVRNVGSNSFKFRIEEWGYLNQAHTDEDVGYVVLEEGTHRLRDGTELDVGTIDTDHDWTTVRSGVASEPVVLSQCQTVNGGDAVVTRHRNVGGREFDVRLQEEEAENGQHRTETVGYLAISRPDTFEFGVALDDVTDEWSRLDYEADFHELPATVASIQTFDGTDPASVRMKNPTSSGVEIQIEEEISGARPANEDCIPLDPQNVGVERFGNDDWRVVDGNSILLAFDNSQNAEKALETIRSYGFTQQCFVGRPDPGMSYWLAESPSSNGGDRETVHVDEQVAYVATPEGLVYYASGKQLGEAGVVTRNQASGSQWHAITLDETYSDPVVFAQLMSKNGRNPAHTRVRNVGSNSFEFQIEEWDYLNQAHMDEDIGYVVLESGLYPLPNGRLLEVGTTRTNHSWTSVSLNSQLGTGEDAVIVSRCQTHNGGNAVVTRYRNVSAGGFDVRLQEEEGSNGLHRTETIGYLAAVRDART